MFDTRNLTQFLPQKMRNQLDAYLEIATLFR